MAKWRKPDAGFDDVESLVRAAGNYVRPSDDLRPRVLETARAESRERRNRRRMWQLAVVVALLGALTTAEQVRREAAAAAPGLLVEAAAFVGTSEQGDTGWGLVDAYTQLRRKQAAMLRLSE
jgi:hypothetical protein